MATSTATQARRTRSIPRPGPAHTALAIPMRWMHKLRQVHLPARPRAAGGGYRWRTSGGHGEFPPRAAAAPARAGRRIASLAAAAVALFVATFLSALPRLADRRRPPRGLTLASRLPSCRRGDGTACSEFGSLRQGDGHSACPEENDVAGRGEICHVRGLLACKFTNCAHHGRSRPSVPVRQSAAVEDHRGRRVLLDSGAVRHEQDSGCPASLAGRGPGGRGPRSISGQQVLACGVRGAAVPQRPPAEPGRCRCQG
jgi:hypothetical protein